MFGSSQLYEIYTHTSLPEEDATKLVRQGFSAWAFLFHIPWLLYQRLWTEALLFTLLYSATIALGDYYSLSDTVVGALQIALQFWLGANASDLRAQALERKNYVLTDVTTGSSALEAERRYYHVHTACL